MKVGIIQPNYIPWRGYFDFINSVEKFILLDDLQYTDRDWRNRNKIKTRYGLRWLTVPVKHIKRSQLINNTIIDSSQSWQIRHNNQIYESYKMARYFDDVTSIINRVFNCSPETISELNYMLICEICNYLGINTKLYLSSQFKMSEKKTERLILLLKAVGADTYVSGPNANVYLDLDQFIEAEIALEYKSYNYLPYPQLFPPFEGAVSIIDLIANCGPESIKYLKSQEPNKVVVK